ncbi:pentapeptide repeat-containing protein [Blautia producta]|uniref:pentapeptide repeat-containing protein n=1 Tax=Blautia producta TaxID=33035 RepID=UPI0034DDAA7C
MWGSVPLPSGVVLSGVLLSDVVLSGVVLSDVELSGTDCCFSSVVPGISSASWVSVTGGG